MKLCPSCKTEFPGGEVFCPNDGARLVTPSQIGAAPSAAGDDPMIGSVLSERYRILRQIGEGGMGLVYEAEHVTIEKRVALKVLRDDFSSRSEVVERFKQEAKSASRIGNEHIVDISDFGVTPSGASYFVMELLEGEDLANVLSRDGQLSVARAADILRQCCKALGAAHAKGIVHRDMKPENIFLTTRGATSDFVKIVDFGIAKMSDIETPGAPGRKLTKTGMIFGTPEYMSPEQAAGKATLDHRVDVYALAVIFFEMITGRVPFVGDTFMGILTQHMFEDPPRIEEVNPHVAVPEPVVSFLYRGLAKEPDERYQTCQEMALALDAARQGRGVGTHPGFAVAVAPSARTPRPLAPASMTDMAPVSPPRSRLGVALGAGAVILAAALGGGAVWYFGNQGAAHEGGTGGIVATPLRPSAPDAGAEAAAAAEPDAGSVQAEPAPEPDAGPPRVSVTVATSPQGARVFVVGRGEVCEATPCAFHTTPGEPITVRARRGRSEAESELTPTANTMMQLELRPARGGRTPERGGQGGGRNIGGGELKVPPIFRNP